jgi:Ca-activated chloride channel family protein
VPFAKDNHATAIKNKLKQIVPKGTTPIAYTLEQCGNDFPTASARQTLATSLSLITDGIEECDGDPCAVSLALQKKGIILKTFCYWHWFGSKLSEFISVVLVNFMMHRAKRGFKNILNIVVFHRL